MNWLVMLHRLLDDPAYTPTDELRSFGLAAREGMYNTALIDREMDDQAQYVQAEIFKGMTMDEMDEWMRQFMQKPCEGLDGLTWGTAFYWPMIEGLRCPCPQPAVLHPRRVSPRRPALARRRVYI